MKLGHLAFAAVLSVTALHALAEADEEDFEVQEEGMLFDHPRTGLMYRRNVYVEGDDVTHRPNYPTAYNDTRDIRQWKIFISHWEQDPPSFLTVYMMDDSPYAYSKATIDLRVTIGQYDRNKNLVPASRRLVKDIPVNKGITRIPINIHNYKGDIVSVHLVGVNQKIPIHPIDFTDD
jgi:hypothetical protein